MVKNEREKMISMVKEAMGFPDGYLKGLNDVDLAQLYWTAESYVKDWEETA